MRLAAALVCIVTHIGTVNANVEKTVFLGPSPVTLQHVRPGLDDLGLQVLTPSDTVLSTRLRLQFPTHSLPRGLESWYLLRQLDGARRYEVRICWPATVSPWRLPFAFPVHMRPQTDHAQQPTDFWLETFPPAHVFATPELVSSLAQYSEQRQAHVNADGQDFKGVASEAPESVLFLRLQAAASYYSTNRTLMDDPPAVDADISMPRLNAQSSLSDSSSPRSVCTERLPPLTRPHRHLHNCGCCRRILSLRLHLPLASSGTRRRSAQQTTHGLSKPP